MEDKQEVKLDADKAEELSQEELAEISGGDNEQVLSIGSQSSGAGAGKIKFNPF
ncbi:MAG TPA: bacteriocin [Bryobacteraceae bacterium]|nr:bacteriocin [Bryobacteraceae bacterium]